MAERHPTIVALEDLHWADDGLLDFVDYLLEWTRDVPLLVVCTARPELLTRRPQWGGGKTNALTLALAPLSDEDTTQLVHALLETSALPVETQHAFVGGGGGTPLYAEEFARLVTEQGSGADAVQQLPETVQGIIAARLDGLAPEEKPLLQHAAVVGEVFWLGAVADMAGVERTEAERALHDLERREFVRRARDSSVEGETEYAFKHVLVRDVAYGQIPRADRARKHLRAAEWIESLGRPDDHAEMVAHHYVNALELTRASGGSFDGLVTRARDALRDAGARALSLNAVAQAERYFSEALDLTAADDPERLQLLYKLGQAKHIRSYEGTEELEQARDGFVAAGDPESAAEAVLRIADNVWSRGQGERVRAHLEDARSLVAGRPPSRVQAFVLEEASRYAMLGDRNEESIALGREALRMADELGLDDVRSHALNNIGAARVAAGDPRGIQDLDEALEVATRLNHAEEIVRAYHNRGTMKILLGQLAEATADMHEAYRLAQHFGHRGFARWTEAGPLIGQLWYDGSWDEIVERTTAFIDALGGEGHYQAATSYLFRGMVRAARADD